MHEYSSTPLGGGIKFGLFPTMYLTRYWKKSYIYLTIICTTPNTVKEMRTLHVKSHASLKILENAVPAI